MRAETFEERSRAPPAPSVKLEETPPTEVAPPRLASYVSTMLILGKLERVDPRSLWKHEAHDFTPWLAENLALLGELLGLELELQEREAGVGDFSVDLLARDLGRNRLVVIENQLEPTDHGHLGQLITYAAGLDAQVVVWVSREFREEHRQALDWLNRGDGNGTEYFGVALEVVRIAGSPPAVNFRLVASPNNWSRRTRTSTVEEPSERGTAYQTFFQGLIDELREKHKFTNAKAAQPQSWYSFSSGVARFTYGFSFAAKGELRCELYIDFPQAERNKAIFDRLLADKDGLEVAYQEALRWERLDNRRACRIACYAPGSVEDAADVLEAHRKWAIDHLLRFKAVFGQRLAKLAKETDGGG